MSSKDPLDDDDFNLFQQTFGEIRKIKQDKIQPQPVRNKQKIALDIEKRINQKASFYFSDNFVPDLSQNGPLQYVQAGFSKDLAKRIRRGDYYPDFILDLHGLKRESAKLEIAALIQAAVEEQVRCICIVHGLGTGILKQKTPHWLVQHPSIAAFHQAPLEWGGQGAILALVDLGDDELKLG